MSASSDTDWDALLAIGANQAGEWVPGRGDIIWADLEDGPPTDGKGQTLSRHPAMVLSAAEYNARSGLILMCPITTQLCCNPFHEALPFGSVVSGFVVADQLRSIDWRVRHCVLAGRVPTAFLRQVTALSRVLLGVH